MRVADVDEGWGRLMARHVEKCRTPEDSLFSFSPGKGPFRRVSSLVAPVRDPY